jgi:hypothetical protein
MCVKKLHIKYYNKVEASKNQSTKLQNHPLFIFIRRADLAEAFYVCKSHM